MKRPEDFGELAGRLRAHVARAGHLTTRDWIALLKAPLEVPLFISGPRFRAVTFDVKGGELKVREDWELIGS